MDKEEFAQKIVDLCVGDRMRMAIININAGYEVPKDAITEEEILDFVNNVVVLPSNYVENSFEYVKTVEE